MKRILAAAALFLSIFAVSILSAYYLSLIADELQQCLLAGSSLCADGDYLRAKKETERYNATLRKNEWFLCMFVRKENLQALYSATAQLPAYCCKENAADYAAAVSCAVSALQQICKLAWQLV